ncbi:prenyltransferase/squalene oxidase repeat-containing protein [Prosthecobacter vanneervenii]|uniref:Squalene-hopene/tetraprenyl-beta-curcumene cyclase n=1 Tax=Prosthecobacter vanneervenii TaxID=48466 RepID=A0A7W7YAA6_9BACT|nr:prenyltransferase/squalene oxidase repeat-containing protein [Prosthecobacter vanneervenii]MBB5032409.1 squalene-hopene/tetraprenyl-beta-curcumene cyclase [Prosthecobacter vanneervenii]
MKHALFLLLTTSMVVAADPKPKPEFQYKTEGIQVSIPTADEPRVKAFGPDTIKAAAKYLDDGAICWVREKTCVNCHTTGPYLSERPALSRQFGQPLEEVLADFVKTVPAEVKPQKETEKDGIKYYGGSWTSIWRSLGLAEWDKHVTGKLSAHTERSLHEMLMRQSANGSFVSYGEVEIPHITTDFELTLQAARAVTSAPGWLSGLKDAELLARIEKMKSWLRTAEPKNDYDRILHLQLAHYMPDLVPQAQRDAALALLSSKQHADGGWSLRDMSALSDWHFKMSDTVVKLVSNLPDAAKPESDAYMTAFAVVLMRQNNIPASDERIQRAVTWLKREQRVSGRWWMHSLYRGNYHYITYIATAQALKALALCDELH